MHFTGMTFRPPYEAWSLILQVTSGCSHNKCSFCAMYKTIPFDVSPLEEVEEDLIEASMYQPGARRVFLANGDAFCLPADRLATIAELIHKYLPEVKTIGGYATIHNIASKTDDELKMLAELGYADFNIGLESALDDVLGWMNKGYTSAEAREQLLRLGKAGMPFNLNIIHATAGPDRIEEHAQACADMVNTVKPSLVFVSPLHADPGTPLTSWVEAGEFTECTLGDYITEEIEFLKRLELGDCTFFGRHISNPVQVSGVLPRDKRRMLSTLEKGKNRFTPEQLRSTPRKGMEGVVEF